MKIYSFPPIANSEAVILLLGTMPGAKSLEAQEYYAHPQNSFWKLVSTVLEVPFPIDYSTKQELLLHHQIALWDVLQACEREGSLDSAIVKEVPNDFDAFLQQHPNIRHIYFNGQKAAAFFKKYVKTEGSYTLTTLPSTSPANAGKRFEQKLAEWRVIKP